MNGSQLAGCFVPWILAIGALLLVLFCLLGDAMRLHFARVRRCPKCWYDLSHTPSRTCSECGFAARHERQLVKWRRHWWPLGLLLVVGAAGYTWRYGPAIRKHGWIAGVPTGILVHLTPSEDNEYTSAKPVSPGNRPYRLHPVTAELKRRIDAQEHLTQAQWRTLLKRAQLLAVHDRWPIDEPFEAFVRPVSWARTWIDPKDIFLTRDGKQIKHNLLMGITQTGYGSIWSSSATSRQAPVSGVGLGRYELHVNVESWTTGAGMKVVTSLTFPITFVETVEEAIDPVTTPAIDSIVRDHLCPLLIPYSENEKEMTWIRVTLPRIDDPHTRAMVLQVEVDVLEDGKLIAHGLVDENSSSFGYHRGHDLMVLGNRTYEQIKAQPQRYTLRIRGNARRALCDARAAQYWAGALDFPCTEVDFER